jgi:predicted histidine transporter YuiF (NhaC family)
MSVTVKKVLLIVLSVLLVAGLYIIIGLILAYRKPAKFAKKNRPAAAAPMEEEVPMEETEETEEAETEAPEEE